MTNKTDYLNNATKTALAQGAGAVLSNGFRALMVAVGHPEIVALTPLVRGAAIGVMNTCYDDVTHRMLSAVETDKVQQVNQIALSTFFEMAEKDGVVAIQQQIDDGHLQYAFEVAEDVVLTSIRQSERIKIDVLGRYYGSELYRGFTDWQDMHQMITMAGTLTLRQLVLIRLIAESFPGQDKSLYISNPSACVETRRLLDYGIWQTEGAAFGINDSASIQLSFIEATDYAEQVCTSLMLDRLSDEDVARTIDSLRLTAEGTPNEVLTQDDYKQRTEWQVFHEDGILSIDQGTY